MADDVKSDQVGSSNNQSTRRITRRIPTRSSTRSKSASNISASNISVPSSSTSSSSVYQKEASQQRKRSASATSLPDNKPDQENKPKKKEKKAKLDNKDPTSEVSHTKQKSKANKSKSGKATLQKDQTSVDSSNVASHKQETGSKKEKKRKERQEEKESTKRTVSDSKLLRSPKVLLKRSHSEACSSATGKGRKRKKEVPAYSPKKLRSASRSNFATIQGSGSTAKTGGRVSRLRGPRESGEAGSSSSNLGSCASSRRQRRARARVEPPAMENERNGNTEEQEEEATEDDSATFNADEQMLGAVASFPASGGSSSSQDGDGMLGLDDSDITRLQALLEARGLPPHLFGSLGPRMHLLLHKTFNSGAGTKAQQLITSMQSESEGTQLQGVMEMCQLLVMGNEETLGGFPVKQVVPVLITLLKMEHNFDIMNHACRALTYLMEALPRSSVVVIDAVATLLEKLQTIQCMDVAEQSLTALEMLSKRHGKHILQAGGLGAGLLFLDFFSIVAQRSALAIAANCCHSVTVEEFHLVKDSIAILSGRLKNQDKKSLESVCSAFARIVDNIQKEKVLLESLCEHGLLANLKQLLMVTPPIISSGAFVMVIRMLAVMCTNCPSIAVQLMKLDITEAIRYLLIGSNEIPVDEIVELVPRSPQELYEITCLICELLPTLPTTGPFLVDTYLSKGPSHNVASGTWQWRDDRNAWHTYLWVDNRIIEAAYQSGEDEINLSTLGRNYIIDFTTMQQINEDTGTIRTIQRKSGVGQQAASSAKSNEKLEDERACIFSTEPELGKAIVQSLIAVVYDVYYSSVGPAIKHKCLTSMLKMLYHSTDNLLQDVLAKIPISSYIAGMLSSQDIRITCSALQKAELLMSKVTDTFHVYFRREGVMHKIKSLADGNLPGTPSGTPTKGLVREEDKQSQATASTSLRSKNNSVAELAKSFDDIGAAKESQDVSSSGSSSRLAALKSKKKSLKRFGRQRSSKSSLTEESPPTTHSKKVLNEPTMRPKSATFSSTSLSSSSGTSSKSSFFSNFAPRWGRSHSYHNTSQASTTNSADKTMKEQYMKEQEQNREKVKAWITKTAQELYQNYFAEDSGHLHPASDILQKLTTSSEELSVTGNCDEGALKNLRDVLLKDDKTKGVSAFEIVHSGMVSQLLKYLTSDGGKDQTPRSTRIKRFLTIFLALDTDSEFCSSKIRPSGKPPLVALIQKLNLCINQLEQFPVKCQDIPGSSMTGGSRGSSALRFFNTHQIKCKLLRDPGYTNVKQWSGGAVKIDPLALVQAIERYLVVRGYGRVREGIDNDISDDDEHSDDEIEESWANQLQSSSNPKHILEFTLNGRVLPYNMTVYQAVRQYANTNLGEEPEIDDESGPFGRSSIWSSTHTLQFRPVTLTQENKSTTAPKRTKSDFSVKSILRSKGSSSTETTKPNGFSTYLVDKLPITTTAIKDPSSEVICLMRVLYYLNKEWSRFFSLQLSTAVVSSLEFINAKLTSKATRQLQDPLVIMTGNLPSWLSELAKACPFIFPFECRQLLFYTTTFDRDRAVMKLQETVPDLASTDSSDRVTPRLDKKKRTVSRIDLLKQAETVVNEFVNTRSLLEIQYEGEVGTGLGPTLEFYTLVSKEFQRTEQEMWRGEHVDIVEGEGESQKKTKYLFSRNGLFPTALSKSAKISHVNKMKNKFRFLGKFIAKACMDSRMIDIPFSQTFYKSFLNPDQTMDISDLQHVDATLHKSLSQLNEAVLQKHKLERDETQSSESLHLALSSLTLDGVAIEELALDFLLPGTNIELKKNGKDTPVTIMNLEEYLKLVVQISLKDGVAKQVQAFREGFETFCPVNSLQMFYPDEMELLFCGSRSEPWDAKELLDCCRADHGYTMDSRGVKFLFEIMSKYTAEEQRMFLQFITGSPRLPVGGFKSLNPPLTIVRKTVDGTLNADDYLPSVMTCVNYLKLPDYSTEEIMSNQLRTAYDEGKNAFHLS